MNTVETILSLAVLFVSCGFLGLMMVVKSNERILLSLSDAYFELR